MGFKQISVSLFSIMMIVGVVTISSRTAFGQWNNGQYNNQNWDGYPNWGGSFDLRQTALNAGFNDGMKAGQKDLSRGRRPNFNDTREYRTAKGDYSSRLGDRSLYQRYYRIAFEHGYAEPWANTNGGYNNNNNGTWNNNNNGSWNNNGNGSWNNGNNNGGWNNNNGTWNNGNRTSRGRNWGQYGTYGGSADFRQTALNAGYNEGIKEGRKDRSRGPRNFNDFSAYRNANTDYNSRNGDLGLYQRYYREGFENGYADGMNGY